VAYFFGHPVYPPMIPPYRQCYPTLLFQPVVGDRAFSAAEPRVWNYLPMDIRQPDLSCSRFRQLLRRFIWSLGPKRSANSPLFPFKNALEILFLLTYLIRGFLGTVFENIRREIHGSVNKNYRWPNNRNLTQLNKVGRKLRLGV